MRALFKQDKVYPARVHAVRDRPLENARLTLLRLEFEIFVESKPNYLASTGKTACRDLAVGPGLELTGDTGVMPLILALRMAKPNQPAGWLALNETVGWVEIKFGPVSPNDYRNTFRGIFPFDPAGCEIAEYDFDLHQEWVSPQSAADDLGTSASTIRRLVAKFEPEFGAQLVRRTDGGHRRINVPLLRNLGK